ERAAIALVGDTVTVAVAVVGRPAHGQEHAQIRRADAAHDAGAAAGQDAQCLGGPDANAAAALERARVEVHAGEAGAAEDLGDAGHAIIEAHRARCAVRERVTDGARVDRAGLAHDDAHVGAGAQAAALADPLEREPGAAG